MTDPLTSAYTGDEPYVFVSYSHQDRSQVLVEIQWLQSQGFHVWFDEGIEAGHEWHQDLADRISGCSLFLYFVTPGSVRSPNCLREVHYAVEHGQQLLTVHLEATELPGGLRLSLGSVQAILRHELSPMDYRLKLLRAVGRYTERGVGAAQEVTRPSAGTGWKLPAAAALGALLIGVAGTLLLGDPQPAPAVNGTSRHLELQVAGLRNHAPAISRDGRRFFDYDGLIRTRLVAGRDWTSIPGSQEATFTVPSPGGARLAYCGNNKLYVIPLSGGVARLVGAGGQCGLAWIDEDVLLYSSEETLGIMQVPALGGTPMRLTTADEGTYQVVDSLLPDRQGILLTTFHTSENPQGGKPQIGVVGIDGGEIQQLTEGVQGFYVPTGHLLFYRDNSIWAVGFDPRSWQMGGVPVPVVSDVATDGSDYGSWSFSDDGTLIYLPTAGPGTYNLVWVDRQGRETTLSSRSMAYRNPEISPSGDQIAVTVGAVNQGEIWTYSLDRNTLSRLSFDGGWQPTWLDDEHVLFGQTQGQSGSLLVSKRADGRGAVEVLGRSDRNVWYANHAASGDLVGSEASDLARLRVEDGQIEVLLASPANEIQPRLSDDGRWLAYASDESGRYEVYVRPFPEVTAGKWQVSEAGGGSPVWSRDGTELYYLTLDGILMAVRIDTARDGFATLGSTQLFDASPYPGWAGLDGTLLPEFDVSPDGSRFLMIRPTQRLEKTAYVVVDWFEELKRLVPR